MEIKTARFIVSSPKIDLCPIPDRPEYAFIGRSNVGKSSLINMITRNGKLAKISATPGKTTLINHFLINENENMGWYMVDLPGYGYAKRALSQRKEWGNMIQDYFVNRSNLITVFVLIDARLLPQKNDLDFLGQLGELKVPFTLIFTKADKAKQSIIAKNVNAFVSKMKEDWEYIPAKFVTSAEKGLGREKLLQYIQELNEELHK